MQKNIAIVGLSTVLFLSSCATTGTCEGKKEECGAGFGAIMGTVAATVIASTVDSELAAGLLGVATILGGAYLGQQYGKHLDEQDTKLAQSAAIQALNSRDGKASWTSETNEGVGGEITVIAVEGSANCKLADHLITTAGGPQTVQTEFCQKADGSWEAKELA